MMIPSALKKEAEDRAERQGISVAELTRDALRAYLKGGVEEDWRAGIEKRLSKLEDMVVYE